MLIASTLIPKGVTTGEQRVRSEVTRGVRLMFGTPVLRATVVLDLGLALVGTIPMALTIPLAMNGLGGRESDGTTLLAAFGVGSMLAATLMPRLIARYGPRRYMLTGLLVIALAMMAVWPALLYAAPGQTTRWLLGIWFVAGGGYSAVIAPMGRVVRDAVPDEDLPHVFAARFSVSHGWWLIGYPLAGWTATALGFGPSILMVALLSLVAAGVAARQWPAIADPAPSAVADAAAEADI